MRIFAIIFIFLFALLAKGQNQNLVPMGDFENFVGPTGYNANGKFNFNLIGVNACDKTDWLPFDDTPNDYYYMPWKEIFHDNPSSAGCSEGQSRGINGGTRFIICNYFLYIYE